MEGSKNPSSHWRRRSICIELLLPGGWSVGEICAVAQSSYADLFVMTAIADVMAEIACRESRHYP